MLKVVVDTQIILRDATSARPTAWDAGRFTLLLSEPMLEEIEDVVSRLIEVLRRGGTLVTPTVRIARSRDPDDDKFLECAVAGNANYVVSADADLLTLGDVEGIPIVDAPTFWEALARTA